MVSMIGHHRAVASLKAKFFPFGAFCPGALIKGPHNTFRLAPEKAYFPARMTAPWGPFFTRVL